MLENVILDENGVPDYDDIMLTENTRAAYPLHYIDNALLLSVAGHPKTIIFLTADAFGVLPPVAKLTTEQAMYHYLSGYTSKVAGTEDGIVEPQATFSIGFGEPFLPLPPLTYAKMLGERINKYGTAVYLVNTGWSAGPYGQGHRIRLQHTRRLVNAVLDGELDKVEWETFPVFGLAIPKACEGVPSEILNPRDTWADKEAYDLQLRKLAELFGKNVAKFHGLITEEILSAGPKA